MLGSVVEGAMAVASGLCKNVVVFRTMTESSAQAGKPRAGYWQPDDDGVSGYLQWPVPFGSLSGAPWMAPYAQRYFHDYGATREQLAWLALNARRHAVRHPHPVHRAPPTLDPYPAPRITPPPPSPYARHFPLAPSTPH